MLLQCGEYYYGCNERTVMMCVVVLLIVMEVVVTENVVLFENLSGQRAGKENFKRVD
jgi:hypothetical protein